MSSSHGSEQITGAQSVARAFAVLRLFRDQQGDVGVGEVARELQLNPSTTHRIVRALVAEGYLAQNEETERYYLGTASLLLGQAAAHNFGLDVVYPVLEKLAKETGESVNLGVLDGQGAVVVERIESTQPLRFTQPPGTRVALHASSMGKALLAFNADLAVSALPPGVKLAKVTAKSLVSLTALRADLTQVRRRGWSEDDEESAMGVRCVAAPIIDRSGVARAALAVQAPAVRVPDDRFAQLGPRVVLAAREIALLLPRGHGF